LFGESPAHEANTVPATVACSPEVAADGAVVGAADVVAVPVAASGWVPGAAEASTRDTARKPTPTAAAAEATHAPPRATVGFMSAAFPDAG
jgi:hypothetical protein